METSSLSGPVTETWNALRKFIGDAGSAGATSLACVTVTALTTLNKRQLVMENAAAGTIYIYRNIAKYLSAFHSDLISFVFMIFLC